MFEGLVGSIIWALANILYVDLKRKGKAGWSRIILFWMGIPLTWLWFFIIREGSAPELEEAPDDADAILAEIQREKRLKPGASDGAALEPTPDDG
ncbi:MAG: hypothetical protein HKO65_09655 [Gemmatimonadetes bacterium]|nr:hypothetical protein [Gemmatimonadota bacterium]NNM05357.1 hypothetical protein [Gemmatimonadota bacterium]